MLSSRCPCASLNNLPVPRSRWTTVAAGTRPWEDSACPCVVTAAFIQSAPAHLFTLVYSSLCGNALQQTAVLTTTAWHNLFFFFNLFLFFYFYFFFYIRDDFSEPGYVVNHVDIVFRIQIKTVGLNVHLCFVCALTRLTRFDLRYRSTYSFHRHCEVESKQLQVFFSGGALLTWATSPW